jgi:hypothetical protein
MNTDFHPLSRFSDYPWDVFDEDILEEMMTKDTARIAPYLTITGDLHNHTPYDQVETVATNLGFKLIKEFKGVHEGHQREYQVWWSQGVCAVIQGKTSTERHPLFLADFAPPMPYTRADILKLQVRLCDKAGTNLLTSTTSFLAVMPCLGVWQTLRTMNRIAYIKAKWGKIPTGVISHYFEGIEDVIA